MPNPKSLFPFWLYALLGLASLLGVLALNISSFLLKSGTATIGILILLILFISKPKASNKNWLIVGAFAFSIAGDWFLSNMKGDSGMFVQGIALYFLAHLGYLIYACINGKINWKVTGGILLAFLAFYFLTLAPAVDDSVLKMAVLVYLLVSCLSMGAALGMNFEALVKWPYVFGIFLILFSDTVISFKEFLGYDGLNYTILPTYYLAHVCVVFSLIQSWQEDQELVVES